MSAARKLTCMVELTIDDAVGVGMTLRALSHTSLADASAANRLDRVGSAMVAAALATSNLQEPKSIIRIVCGDACVTAERADGGGWGFSCQVCGVTWWQQESADATALGHMYAKHDGSAQVKAEPTMCDGRHDAPPCNDPFCWHRPLAWSDTDADAEGAP